MLNDKTLHGLWIATVTASTLLWCGCRSVPGLNRFVRTSEPSAEVLAGTGPSATYPAPPSASATPQAIASVAGGTSGSVNASVAASTPAPPTTSQVAGIDVSPGFATPATQNLATNNPLPSYTASQSGYSAPQPNYAAANANGVYAQNPGNHPTPSPYTFGTKTFTPNTAPETSPVLPKTGYGNPSTSSYAKSAYTLPSTTAKANSRPSAVKSTSTAAPSSGTASVTANEPQSMGGFALPTNIATTASSSLTPPAAATAANEPSGHSFGLPSNLAGNVAGQAATSPAFSTASAAADPINTAPTSYTPGSTGKSQGYPGNDRQSPATSGSFYR